MLHSRVSCVLATGLSYSSTPQKGILAHQHRCNHHAGSPQRAKATFRRAMQQPLSAAGACTAVAAASIGGPMTDMVAAAPVPKAAGAAVVPVCDAVQLSGPRLCGLTHREVLQAGIQELTGAFYHKLRQQQWQQHQVQQQQFGRHAAAVPLSWFGVC